MAISRKTQKDVGKYQAKLVGPFTIRQTIYVGIAGLIAILLWNTLDVMQLPLEDKVVAVLIVAAPIALLGFLNPYGMTCLEFIKQYYEYHILSSKTRVYKTVTDDEIIVTAQEKEMQNSNNKKSKSKKNKEATVTHVKLKDFPEYN